MILIPLLHACVRDAIVLLKGQACLPPEEDRALESAENVGDAAVAAKIHLLARATFHHYTRGATRKGDCHDESSNKCGCDDALRYLV